MISTEDNTVAEVSMEKLNMIRNRRKQEITKEMVKAMRGNSMKQLYKLFRPIPKPLIKRGWNPEDERGSWRSCKRVKDMVMQLLYEKMKDPFWFEKIQYTHKYIVFTEDPMEIEVHPIPVPRGYGLFEREKVHDANSISDCVSAGSSLGGKVILVEIRLTLSHVYRLTLVARTKQGPGPAGKVRAARRKTRRRRRKLKKKASRKQAMVRLHVCRLAILRQLRTYLQVIIN